MIQSDKPTWRAIPCIAMALLLLLGIMITAPNGDDAKPKGSDRLSEVGALRIALGRIEKLSLLEGRASYEITAKFEKDEWYFRFVPLPKTADLEMSVFVKKDGTSKISP